MASVIDTGREGLAQSLNAMDESTKLANDLARTKASVEMSNRAANQQTAGTVGSIGSGLAIMNAPKIADAVSGLFGSSAPAATTSGITSLASGVDSALTAPINSLATGTNPAAAQTLNGLAQGGGDLTGGLSSITPELSSLGADAGLGAATDAGLGAATDAGLGAATDAAATTAASSLSELLPALLAFF